MAISTEKLKQRIERLKQAAGVKWLSVHAAQEILEVADALAELLAAKEAQSKPIAWALVTSNDGKIYNTHPTKEQAETYCRVIHQSNDSLTLNVMGVFTAPPAPAVPAELLDAMAEVIRISDRDHEAWDRAKAAISACRAAMLEAQWNHKVCEWRKNNEPGCQDYEISPSHPAIISAPAAPTAYRYRYNGKHLASAGCGDMVSSWKYCEEADLVNPDERYERQELFAAPPALPANTIGRPATPDDSPYPATVSGGCLLAQAWADGYNVRNAVTAPPAVPAGFKLVPAESNDAWAERYCELTNKHPDGGMTTYIGDGAVTITFREKSKREIDAMLAAAPTPTK